MTNLFVIGDHTGVEQWVNPGGQRCIDLDCREIDPLLDVCLEGKYQRQLSGRVQAVASDMAGSPTMSMAVLPNRPLSARRATYRAMALLSHTPPCGVSRVGTYARTGFSCDCCDRSRCMQDVPRNKHLAERVQLEKIGRFVCLAHLHRRHVDLRTDIAGSDQCLESVLVTRRRPQLICRHDCTAQ